MKDFDLSEYLKDREVNLKNVKVEDCRISGRLCKTSCFAKCVFHNVVFDRYFEDDVIFFEECEFTECVFHGSLRKSYLVLKDNLFKNCIFENISMEFGGEKSYIAGNGFFRCNFKNVKLIREIEFLNQTISGGKIEDAFLISPNMAGNQFSDMQMENVRIMAYYSDNVMASVVFRSVTLEWEADRNYDDGNMFYQCDTSGLTCCERQ